MSKIAAPITFMDLTFKLSKNKGITTVFVKSNFIGNLIKKFPACFKIVEGGNHPYYIPVNLRQGAQTKFGSCFKGCRFQPYNFYAAWQRDILSIYFPSSFAGNAVHYIHGNILFLKDIDKGVEINLQQTFTREMMMMLGQAYKAYAQKLFDNYKILIDKSKIGSKMKAIK